eukprot:2631733-Rhodomonas_salina.4
MNRMVVCEEVVAMIVMANRVFLQKDRCSALEEALGERVEEVQKLEIELGEEKEKAKRKSEMSVADSALLSASISLSGSLCSHQTPLRKARTELNDHLHDKVNLFLIRDRCISDDTEQFPNGRYKDMKDAFEEERARAEKCKNEADRCSHDIGAPATLLALHFVTHHGLACDVILLSNCEHAFRQRVLAWFLALQCRLFPQWKTDYALRVAELRGKIETMEFTHEEIAAKLTIEEERGRQLEAESIGVRECADEEKAVVQRELAEAKLKIEELTKSVEEGKERERRLEEQNAAVREEKQLFSDDIAAFRSRLETMEANIKQAELEKASLRSDLAAALRETETVRKSLQGKLASAAAEKEALQKKTEEDSRTIESLQQKAAKVASLEDDVALLTKAAGKAKELEARLRESKGGASELAAEHKQEVERLTRRWKEHKGKLEKEIELLKSQVLLERRAKLVAGQMCAGVG